MNYRRIHGVVPGVGRLGSAIRGVYFDSGNLGPCLLFADIVPKPADWPSRLETKLRSRFGSRVYTWSEFLADGEKLPSAQELLRRDKHIVPIANDPKTSTYIFPGTTDDGVLRNNSANNTVGLPMITVSELGDRSFARAYPNGWVCGTGEDGWERALSLNFTFPASNCSSKWAWQLHPPIPTYVRLAVIGDRGSWLNPYGGTDGVATAINRARMHEEAKDPSIIPIEIEAGTYNLQGRFSTAVRLGSTGGTVRLK